MTIAQWWYRVSGQQQRDEIASIRGMAQRFGAAAATLLPEITALTAQVGIERVPGWDESTADQCTPTRWRSLTGRQSYWTPSGTQLGRAQNHATHACDFAEGAIRNADKALAMLDRLALDPTELCYAHSNADFARDLAVGAHTHLIQGLVAYDEYARLRDAESAAELAPADLSDLDLPAPAPVEQPIPAPDWPVRQRKGVGQ